MTLSINTNTAAMAALQSLNQTTSDLNKTENAVSTGKTVNDASDNPAIYAIAQTATSQISALSGVSTGLQFAGSALSTASTGATAISDILSSLSTSVTTAANNGVNADTLNSQLSSSLTQIDVNASTATFQGVNLLAGSTGSGVKYTSLSAAQDINGNLFTQQGSNATSTGLGLQGLSTTMVGTTLTLGTSTTAYAFATKGATASVLTLNNKAEVGTDSTASGTNPAIATQFVMDAKPSDATNGSATTVIDAIAAATTGTAAADISINTDGSLTIKASDLTSSTKNSDGSTNYNLADGDSIVSKNDASGNTTYSVVKADNRDANGNATSITNIVDVNVSSSNSTTSATAKLQQQTSSLMTAMSNQGFGVSLSNDNVMTIAGGNLDTSTASSGATMTAGAGSTATADAAVVNGATSGTAVVQLAIDAAITKMGQIASGLGVATNTVTQLQTSASNLSSSLTTGVGALTDADLAAESAKLTSLQTKQQLAIQSLSIANSQSSTLLSLFRG